MSYTKHKDHRGHDCYTVAGVVTVYNEQEAVDLETTGVLKLNCPLTLLTVESMRDLPPPPRASELPVGAGQGTGGEELRKLIG